MYDQVLSVLTEVKNGVITVEDGAIKIAAIYGPKDVTDEDIIAHLESKPDKYGHIRVEDEEGDEFTIPVFLHDSEPGVIFIGGDRGELYEWDELMPLHIED